VNVSRGNLVWKATAAVALIAVVAGCSKAKRPDGATLGSAETMLSEARAELASGDNRKARHILENIQFTAENRSTLEPQARLVMADATYYQGTELSLIDARALYLDFVTLYADHPAAPYAQFQAGLSSLGQVGHATKDQSQTAAAIRDLLDVERRFPGSPYTELSRLMTRQARMNLAAHDFYVGRFYLKRKRFVAAEERFRKILRLYPYYADKDEVYYYLAKALAGSDNTAEARIYLDKMVHDYPDGDLTRKAEKLLTRVGGALEPASEGGS